VRVWAPPLQGAPTPPATGVWGGSGGGSGSGGGPTA
jgi:hypothetical protein